MKHFGVAATCILLTACSGTTDAGDRGGASVEDVTPPPTAGTDPGTPPTPVIPSGGTDSGMAPPAPMPPQAAEDAGTPDCSDCAAPFRCRFERCVPDLGECAQNADCPGDSYCGGEGECLPYGVPAEKVNDPDCQREPPPVEENVAPSVQCEWIMPEPDQLHPQAASIYSAPMVADFNLDDNPATIRPSIVATTFVATGGDRLGTLRLFDGRTCELQLSVGDGTDAESPSYGAQWAVADLDGDVPNGGRPELIGFNRGPSLGGSGLGSHALQVYALALDVVAGQVTHRILWRGRDCSDGTPVTFGDTVVNSGPGVWDLDDDGIPEVIVDEMVFDAQGCLLNPPASFETYETLGLFNALADVDHDDQLELVRYNRIAEWTGAGWVDAAYWSPPDSTALAPGYVAIADVGDYAPEEQASDGPGDAPAPVRPEVIVVSAAGASRGVRVQSLDGTVLWGPVPIQGSGRGGPPTASDFDGDGQVEFASAGGEFYTVFDPDCDTAGVPMERPGGACNRPAAMAGMPDGILWAQPSQDRSSNVTGSSIFDFDGDGIAEVVYRDECFLRVYNGATGEVRFSAGARSGTGYDYPIIADLDGDFSTEIVVPRAGGVTCPDADPIGEGSASVGGGTGFVVLRDAMDQWVSSRPIWNQHAYSITHVNDDGTVPRTSAMERNWEQEGLNNFRQNTQPGRALELADLTIVLDDVDRLCAGSAGSTTLSARVCNRGTDRVVDGVAVDFVESGADEATRETIEAGNTVCTARTTMFLPPGECERVTCDAEIEGTGNILVVVDREAGIADCTPENNVGAGALAFCPLL